MAFHKVMFSRAGFGTTAGLVVNADEHDVRDMCNISRLFPASAFTYMRVYHVSPAYPSWNTAFGHTFDLDAHGN